VTAEIEHIFADPVPLSLLDKMIAFCLDYLIYRSYAALAI
jgi:hypothetical protein